MWVLSSLACLACIGSLLAKPQGEAAMDTRTESPYDIVEDNAVTQDENATQGSVERCATVMDKNGYNISSFWHGAAHGIHSINLEEIRYFFEPEAPIQNKIPVVNSDLSSEQTILFDAPLAGYDEDFKTMSLKVMAYFMLNDRPDFAIQGANALEKLTHQYHMHEIFVYASKIYQQMKKSPPQDQELCPCVNDVTGNGIMNELVNIAKKMRYYSRNGRARKGWEATFKYDSGFAARQVKDVAQLTTTRPVFASRPTSTRPVFASRPTPKKSGYYPTSTRPVFASRPTFANKRKRRSTNSNNQVSLIEEYEQEYLKESTKENAEKLLDLKPWKPNTLVGPEQWVSYEAMLTTSMLDDKGMKDFATFMYCKLNEPLDHPKDLFTL